MEIKFRNLNADEIEVRTGQISKDNDWFTLLLYQNSRVAMNLLDEVVGPTNWQREHKRDNANCVVSVYDDSKKEWVSKEDTGVESNTQEQKGQASDSFKRACVNWGIGRSLYSSPKIFVQSKDVKKDSKGTFTVKEIEYDSNNDISKLVIINKKGEAVYTYGSKVQSATQSAKPAEDKIMSMITEPQIKLIQTLIGKVEKSETKLFKNFENKDAKENIYKQYGIHSSKELRFDKAKEVIDLLKKKLGE